MTVLPDAGIPVVDLNSAGAAAELLQAAVQYGFIFVKHENLCLTAQDVDQMFSLSKTFFAADPAQKAECAVGLAESGKNQGWISMHTETLDPANQKRGDFKECFNIGEYFEGRPKQRMPSSLKEHEGFVGAFHDRCHAVCNQIMSLLAEGLKIPSASGGNDWFASRHDKALGPSGSVLRLLYYPSLPGTQAIGDSDIRAGAHSDYGSVTLLFRLPGQPGLEIVTPSGEWAAVPVDPVASSTLPILVNIGDLLSYWTNGLLKSTVHRVVFPGGAQMEDRYSIAYFCHPLDSAELEEIPSDRVKQAKPESNGLPSRNERVLTARDHLNSRLAATYGIAA